MSHHPSPLNWASLALLGIIWGASFMATSLTIGHYGPMTVTAARLAIAAVVLTAASYFRGTGLPSLRTRNGRTTWIFCFVLGVFTNAAPFYLLNWAQQVVTSGFAGVTMAAVPLLVLPLAHLLVPGEKMTRNKLIGFLVGFSGVYILMGQDGATQSAGGATEFWARMACVAASFCYAAGTILLRLNPSHSIVSFASGGLICGTLIMTPAAFYFEGLPDIQFNQPFWAVLYLGFLPTALATLVLVHIVKSVGASFMSLVNYQVPIWAVIFGIILLDEAIPASFFTALVLVLTGLGISQYRRTRAPGP